MINIDNLADANAIAAEHGLPLLTVEDAHKYYDRPRFSMTGDRGANDADSGSPTFCAKWAISLVLHEGRGALEAAIGVQNEQARAFWSGYARHLQEQAAHISSLTGSAD